MNLFRLFCVVALFASPVLAEDSYQILLTRPTKAGARFKMSAKVALQKETNIRVQDEEEDMSIKVDAACKISGEVTVVAVTAKGMVKEVKCELAQVETFQAGRSADLLHAGDVIAVKYGADENEVTLNGEEPEEEATLGLIQALLDVSGEDEATDDEAFGTKEKKKVGDEWSANRSVLAEEMARQHIKNLKADDFKAPIRIAETTTVAGEPGLRIVGGMTFESSKASLEELGPGMRLKHLKSSVQCEMDLPLEASSLTNRTRTLAEFEFEAGGKMPYVDQEVAGIFRMKRRLAIDTTLIPLK